MKLPKIVVSIILILCIAGGAALVWKWMEMTQNKAEVVAPDVVLPKVKIISAKRSDFTIYVNATGKVQAARQSQISAEVSGAVLKVSERLQVGEILEKGAFIAEIDSADYRTNLTTAQANVADAHLLLVQERAKAEQNAREWKRLGKGKPSDLVLRKPQLESAKARLLAAEAMVNKAKRDIKKTVITAPYRMMIEQKYIELGNLMVPGGRIADGHSADDLEVKLALTMADYILIKDKSAPLHLSAKVGSETLTWKAKYLRDEGKVDQSTLTIPIIAKVLGNTDSKRFIYPPVNLFVNAKVKAQLRKKVILLPRDAVRLGGIVYLVTKENRLDRREVNVIYTNRDQAIVEGIEEGEQIIVSPMESPVQGMELELHSSEAGSNKVNHD